MELRFKPDPSDSKARALLSPSSPRWPDGSFCVGWEEDPVLGAASSQAPGGDTWRGIQGPGLRGPSKVGNVPKHIHERSLQPRPPGLLSRDKLF